MGVSIAEMVVEHWAEYWLPGSFVSETDTKKLEYRSVEEALRKMPKNAYAFNLYDIRVRTGQLEDGHDIVDRKAENRSGRYYPGGRRYNLDEAKREHGERSILVSNMECNKYDVVKTRLGNYQPIEPGDSII